MKQTSFYSDDMGKDFGIIVPSTPLKCMHVTSCIQLHWPKMLKYTVKCLSKNPLSQNNEWVKNKVA